MKSRVIKAKAGKSFRFDYIGEYGEKLEKRYTIKRSCKTNKGTWVCITHCIIFPTQRKKDIHLLRNLDKRGEMKKHVLAWICLMHGPEEP